MKRLKGFTLVELVITIAIVIILSLVSVPIYRNYIDKAVYTEGHALLGTILSAQKAYYSEYGKFFISRNNGSTMTSYEPVLGIDARGNKYFTKFEAGAAPTTFDYTYSFYAETYKPDEYRQNGLRQISLWYNITSGVTMQESNF